MDVMGSTGRHIVGLGWFLRVSIAALRVMGTRVERRQTSTTGIDNKTLANNSAGRKLRWKQVGCLPRGSYSHLLDTQKPTPAGDD